MHRIPLAVFALVLFAAPDLLAQTDRRGESICGEPVLSHRSSWDCEFHLMVLGRRRGVFEL